MNVQTDSNLPRLAVTLGEPAGIGPELLVRLAHSPLAADIVAIGDRDLLISTATRFGAPLAIAPFDPAHRARSRAPGQIACLHHPLPVASVAGQLDSRNAQAVLQTLASAAEGCRDGRFDGVLTLPVHKGVINDAGIPFTGHTEFFAQRTNRDVLMLLVADDLRVALATTHLPLRAVPDAITRDSLLLRLRLLAAGLRRDFGIASPRIAVLGLNPHAGEDGHLGREEIDIIAPAIDTLRRAGIDIDGPLAADTAFTTGRRSRYDAYLAMYHDQGLTVLKALGFGAAVNVTLGLPFVRTSVDHGVALNLAGSGRADPGSTFAAAGMALTIARNRLAAA
jgi:4-hydroxythreonine-4-phosphate dehydrogenase